MNPRENVVRFASNTDDENDPGSAEQSAQAIINLLRQAAEIAAKNEDRAKGLARQFAEELEVSKRRIQELEHHLQRYHNRATEAERWLVRIHQEIQEGLIEQLTGGQPARRARG